MNEEDTNRGNGIKKKSKILIVAKSKTVDSIKLSWGSEYRGTYTLPRYKWIQLL